MEMHEQPYVSYWRRDPRLEPYCMGEEDPSMCTIHSYWEDNPEMKRVMQKQASPDTYVLLTAACIGFGWAGGPTSGALATAVGGGLITYILSKKHTGKGPIKWLKTRKERSGVEDIYEKILEISDNLDDIDKENKDKINELKDVQGLSFDHADVDNIVVSYVDPVYAEFQGTGFYAWKIAISYPLTQDLLMQKNQNLCVVLMREHDQRICNDPECDKHKSYQRYFTGVFEPTINRGRVTGGKGFIHRTVNIPVPIGMEAAKDNDGSVIISLMGTLIPQHIHKSGSVKKIFGSTDQFESATDFLMEEKERINVRNLHKLMQEILYSDF